MYTPNNIRFRIVSSSAIAQFKQDQAFDFNELINNEAYQFSAEARETLLLNYEVWFKFIIRLEKMMIKGLHSTDMIGDFTVAIDNAAHEILNELQEVIHTHPAIFKTDSKITPLINKAHKSFVTNVFDTIALCSTDSMYVAFPRIVNTISNALHNLLFILHEVENLKKTDGDDFLSMTDEVISIWERTGVCPLAERAVHYKEAFNVDTFFIKNYSGSAIRQDSLDVLNSVGIQIKGVNDLNNFEHPYCEVPHI